jgi:copper homeostasis protein
MVRDAVDIELYAIIRPRGGNFVYTETELELMRRDIIAAKANGVDGVVLGLLNADDTVDQTRTKELIDVARPLQVTFHRAFDACRNFDAALEDVIACGADRLLTAGGQSDAIHNLDTIARLQRNAAGQIRIMAGGGIRIGNVRTIALCTRVCEVHTSLNPRVESTSQAGGEDVPEFQSGFARFVVRESDVRDFKSMLNTISLESRERSPIQ